MKENSSMENSIEENIEELKRLLYRNELTQYGKRKLISYYEQQEKDYKRVLKKNEELRAKWDKDTHILQNELDYANADRIDLVQQNKELRKENEELKHKIEGQECVIETQTHNEEVYEKLVIKLEKENKLAKQALIKNCNISDERNQLLEENKELKEEKDADYTTVYLKGVYDEREKQQKEIKDKIEEYREEIEQLRIEREVTYDSGIYKLELKREALKELLEKGK